MGSGLEALAATGAAALDRLTRVGAMESGQLGCGVRVNCVYPDLVPADMGM